MAFTDPLTITYNAVAKQLVRVNQDKNGADFYLDGTTERFSVAVRHTLPDKAGLGESHMIRLDVDYFDGSSVYVRRGSVWLAARSYDSSQNSTTLGYSANALVGFLTSGNITKLLGREV